MPNQELAAKHRRLDENLKRNNKMDTVEVIFVAHYEQYNVGEIASFPKIGAQKLIEKGLAEHYKR